MRKKRIEKKAEKIRRKKIHDVLEMVLEINGTHPRTRALTGNKPTAFFEFSGRTASTHAHVHKNGWSPYEPADFWKYSRNENIDAFKRCLKGIMEELKRAGKM